MCLRLCLPLVPAPEHRTSSSIHVQRWGATRHLALLALLAASHTTILDALQRCRPSLNTVCLGT